MAEAAPPVVLVQLAEAVLGLCRPGLSRPADIHRLRVAIRRLRVALSVLRDRVGPRRRKGIDRELGWLLKRLGAVREWDVLCGDLARGSERQPRLPANKVHELAARRRRHAMRKARTHLGGNCADRLRKHLRGLGRRVRRDHTGRQDILHGRALARAALEPRLFKVQARAARVDRDDPRALHRLRLRIKKLRYASELFAPMFARAEVVSFLASLRRAQDCLGTAHDAIVEQEQLAGLPRKQRASAEALLAPTEDRRPGAQERQVKDSLRELGQLHPFWIAPRSAGPRKAVSRTRAP